MTPLQFHPILKTTIWGGERIARFKHLDTDNDKIGESWEISAVENNISTVSNPPYQGRTLREVIRQYGPRLLGEQAYRQHKDNFPLLVKFIDAQKDLSIQVHPDDHTARKHGHKQGKTEMWYIVDATPGAKLFSGLKTVITPEEYAHLVETDRICDVLQQHDVKKGDVFYIPAGRIHSIGAGCLIAEIQQTSDVTYRIYDFNRTDSNGQPRPLHTALAAEAIDYNVYTDCKTTYHLQENAPVKLVDSPFFSTNLYRITQPTTIDYSSSDTFFILIFTEGEATVSNNEGWSAHLQAGDTLLIPADNSKINVNGNVAFLETH